MFFMLANSVSGRCNIDTASEGYRGLRYLAQFSFGQVTYVDLEDLGSASLLTLLFNLKMQWVGLGDCAILKFLMQLECCI